MAVSPSRPPSWHAARDADATPPRPPDDARPRQWLVDGYNVLHATLLPGKLRDRTRWWGREERERLIVRVGRFDGIEPNQKPVTSPGDARIGRPTRVWLVFDGTEPAREPADCHELIEVVFAPSADEYLVARARLAEPGQAVFVVSNDRQVAGRCAHAGATIVSPRDFVARCPEDA